jgi:hypothetical protein
VILSQIYFVAFMLSQKCFCVNEKKSFKKSFSSSVKKRSESKAFRKDIYISDDI